jgi:putative spermidine/putrescine transport system permease protein
MRPIKHHCAASMTDRDAGRAGPMRRVARYLYGHPRLQLRLLLAAPLLWLVLAYLGSLAVLFANAFLTHDAFTGGVTFQLTFDNFAALATTEVYRTITLRTLAMAVAVTLICVTLAFPIAYYMARVARPRVRGALLVAVLMPLWASYLVKIYAWRTMLLGNGIVDWLFKPFGIDGPGIGEGALLIVFTYLWLPYMILPIFAALERIPESLVEASSDLGGRAGITFRRVILPLALPGVVAGSIFTFSLTLGDYIAPQLVSNTRLLGNAIYDTLGVPNLPLAAAIATVPVVAIVVYLLVARRTGAFESL